MPPDFEVLERLDDGRLRLRLTTGVLAGRVVTGFPDTQTSTPYQRADRLLRSLLSPEQVEDWDLWQRFRVSSPFGVMEFGAISDIRFWPHSGSGDELRLCVMPNGGDLPIPDIWANLLLAHKANPQWFFTVANWRQLEGEWNFGPVPCMQVRS